jgi:RND family efflux transporter MFP subunit
MIRYFLLGLLLVAGIAGGTYYYFQSRPVAQVMPVQRGTAVSAVYGTLSIDSTYTTAVRSRIEGYIDLAEGIYAGRRSIGMEVKKGQVLATVADAALARMANQLQIDLEAARERARLGPPSAPSLSAAEENVKRLRKLLELQNVAKSEVEKAEAELATLVDRVKKERLELETSLRSIEENKRSLMDQTNEAQLTAPIDGMITGIRFNEGELVQKNTIVFDIASQSTYVSGQVNEEDVGYLRKGMKAAVRLYSYAEKDFTATLNSILPTGDPENQRYTVLLSLDAPPENIRAGMTGEMNIVIGQRENALLIPARALLVDQVLVLDGDLIKQQPVKVGYRSLEQVEILEGVKEGDQVVVADQDLFQAGQRVRRLVINPANARK